MTSNMRVGLVLGAGGVVGMAYHAAALAVIDHDLGWDPRSADVIVGTSAGAIMGALLRRGVPAPDLAALAVGAEPQDTPPGVVRAMMERPEFPPVRLGSFLGRPRVPSPGVIATWARRPWRVDPVAALVSVMPEGSLDMAEQAVGIGEALGTDWPRDDLWICAVRRQDLRRVVFGRDEQAALSDAVNASCAVPGYFRPVDIGGRAYIDGGVRSPTNADVLRRRELDLVVIVSPMSGRDIGRVGAGNFVRRRARSRAEAERDRLRRGGIPSVLIEPGPEVIAVLGADFMSDAHVDDIVRAAFVDTGAQLRSPATRSLVSALGDGPRGADARGRRGSDRARGAGRRGR